MSQNLRYLVGTDTFADSFGYLNDTADAIRTFFSGPSEPPNPQAEDLWRDTGNNLLKERNSTNTDWITIGTLGVTGWGLLSRAGGQMTGAIDMNGNAILNLPAGSGTSPARQQEVDLKAPLVAPQLTGDARVDQDPTGSTSLVRRSWTEGRYAKLSGSVLTGPLTLDGDAGSDLVAVPFRQLRDFAAFNTTAGHRHTGVDARKIRATDLDAAGGADGQLLVHDGAGSLAYSEPVDAVPRPKVKSAIVNPPFAHLSLIYSGGTTSWATFDFTPEVIAGDKPMGAILRLEDTLGGESFAYNVIVACTTGNKFDWQVPSSDRAEFRLNAGADMFWYGDKVNRINFIGYI